MILKINGDISLKKKDWDEKNRVVKKSYQGVSSVTRLNNIIQKRKADAMDIILKLNEAGTLQSLSVTELRSKIEKQNSTSSFYEFSDQLIEELRKSNKIGTARSYNSVILALKKFHPKSLDFEDITYKFLTKFEANHLARGNAHNGFAVYMRTIRSIYNKAIKSGIVEKSLYPFSDFKIKTTPTEKRALDWNLLKKIISLKLKKDHPCFNARNFFLASYMMYGMNFTDMAFLQKTDIINGRINYNS